MNMQPANLPLNEFELAAEDAAARLKPKRISHVARNAFDHIRKAWALREIDPEMANFRAITAQEEAATGVILALKHRRYPGAQLLNERDHGHKMAIVAALHAMRHSLARHEFPEVQLSVSKVGAPRLEVAFDLAKLTGESGPLRAEFPEPFEFHMGSNSSGTPTIHDFGVELRRLASDAGAKDISTQIRKNANRRNELLYASDHGLPQTECTEDYLAARAHLVSALVLVLIGILQTPKHQSLIVQCLEGLLRSLNRVESLNFDYPETEPHLPTFELRRKDDGLYKINISSVGYYRTRTRWRYWNRPWWPRLAGLTLWDHR